MKGNLYLIPVTLGGDNYQMVIPEGVIETTKKLKHFIVEEIRSARRYLRHIDKSFPIDETQFFILNEHTSSSELSHFLDPAEGGSDMGLLSEAGLPCLADPGSLIVSLAHNKGIRVIPLPGPSSIILALIASGMNGQNFTFNGYLPVKPSERDMKIRAIEKQAHEGNAQIFMETPYRNQKLLESILLICRNETRLCIATDLTLSGESVRTMKVSDWKKNMPDLKDKLAVFVMQG
jgi:16S rRNA (cytidine1402-2'-O)-methyltransferase